MMHGSYHSSNYQEMFSKTSRTSTTTDPDYRKLEERVSKLELIAESLWRILQEEHGYDDIRLIEKMTDIDLEDGRYDGKKAKGKGFMTCTKCQRNNAIHHTTCMYCGEPFVIKPFD